MVKSNGSSSSLSGSTVKSSRVRTVPQSYRTNTFSNEVKQDKEIPKYKCAVCCRVLYKEECFSMSKRQESVLERNFLEERRQLLETGSSLRLAESMSWPVLNYRDENGNRISELDRHYVGKHAGTIVVCSRHKSSGAQDTQTVFSYVSDWQISEGCGGISMLSLVVLMIFRDCR